MKLAFAGYCTGKSGSGGVGRTGADGEVETGSLTGGL
jgi:hypothetical protein